ncbi:globin domain-containing protein [Saccharopolyspora thermophila]|uniref:globin domain-containing protein n=1 Tax=Saccharopolyspora thermophila TaxID=89367 RepID=UPI0027E43399|nr:globin domain-containing protein [Saccharopolyspora subtropica]
MSAAIDEIAAVFYGKMFTAHPELLRDLFNRGNQANGEQRQALAGSIVAFARSLVTHPDVPPEAMLNRIAHKHASLGVTRDQYEIVHTHLFAAIAEVLGEAVTEEVAAAWDEVYWLMADALITIETRLYAEANAPDGNIWREYRVVGRYPEAENTVTFLLEPADGSPLPPFRPGQYVSVQVELPDGAHQIRQYSISGTSANALAITVKRVDGEVSDHLHEHCVEGDVLRVSAPFGDVVLDEGANPVLLISAGIGCTPLISMLSHLATTASPRRVIAVHADRSQHTHAFRADLEQLAEKLPDATVHVWYEEPHEPWPAERTGLVDLEELDIPKDATAYICGPLPFMRAIRAQLLERGVPASNIHYEVFGPDLWLAQEQTSAPN